MIDMPQEWLNKGWTSEDVEKAYNKFMSDRPLTRKEKEIIDAMIRDGEEIDKEEKREARDSEVKKIRSTFRLLRRTPNKKREADLSKLKILIPDNGLFTGVAQHLAQWYGKVYYCRPTAGAFLKGSQPAIGKGLPDIEWVEDPEEYYDKVDEIFFPDINFGRRAASLLRDGYKVASPLGGERAELDKIFFLEECWKYIEKHPGINMHFPKTWLPKGASKSGAFSYYDGAGLDGAYNFLLDKKERLWLKGADKNRGDWETDKHDGDIFQTEILFDDKRAELGTKRAKDIILLIQKDIPDAIEIGMDGMRFRGILADWCSCGIEEKAIFYIAKFFKRPPPIFKDSLEGLGKQIYGVTGYQAPYSNENRIEKNGKLNLLDEATRCGNPPTSGLLKAYGKQYALAIHALANSEMPQMEEPKHLYFAEIILSSNWHIKHELHLPEIPKHLSDWLVIRNQTRRANGERYCIQNDCGGHFASMTAIGDSAEEVCGLAEERASELKVYGLTYEKNFLDTMKPKIKMAKEYAGISL